MLQAVALRLVCSVAQTRLWFRTDLCQSLPNVNLILQLVTKWGLN